jgi:antitoxin component of MazEF toxin-antitoxin module
MNRIVREHYPAAKLPDDLRKEIGAEKSVTITIEVENAGAGCEANNARDDWFSKYEHIRRATFHSIDEVNDYVRTLRDEWDHRER